MQKGVLHFGGFVGYSTQWLISGVLEVSRVYLLTIRELHLKLKQATAPDRLVTAGDGAVPFLKIEGALWSFQRSCYEAEWVIFAPLLAAG